MPTTTNVGQVKINVMNKTQYASATKNPNELYVVTDDDTYLKNTATGSNSLTILGDATSASTALNIGPYSTAEGTYSLAIGPGSGNAHRVRATHANAIAIGYDALALAIDAIQLGTGQGTTQGRFKVWNYTMLDKTTGKIPIARLGDDTSTTQGNVLTLDSNGAAVWQAPSGGGSAGQAIDAEIVGTPTINGSVVSNLGTASGKGYLEIPGVFDLGADTTFKIVGAFTNISTITLDDKKILYGHGGVAGGVRISVNGSDLRVYIKDSSGTSQMIAADVTLDPSTKYYFKFEYDGTNYKLWLSTDGVTYTLKTTSAATVLPDISMFTIGNGTYNIQSVDMSGWGIEANGITIWQGMDAPGLHQRVAKGHEVIAFQIPTSSNNYTWYRKYADGWVEQGGNVTATSDASYNVALPVTMANNKYTVFVTRDNGSQDHGEGSINARWCEVWSRTTSSFYTWGIYGDSTDFSWQVSGMAQG